ncbi:MAG: hypothetical protein WBH03_17430 [Cyclobacteriaceae bacterium]
MSLSHRGNSPWQDATLKAQLASLAHGSTGIVYITILLSAFALAICLIPRQ